MKRLLTLLIAGALMVVCTACEGSIVGNALKKQTEPSFTMSDSNYADIGDGMESSKEPVREYASQNLRLNIPLSWEEVSDGDKGDYRVTAYRNIESFQRPSIFTIRTLRRSFMEENGDHLNSVADLSAFTKRWEDNALSNIAIEEIDGLSCPSIQFSYLASDGTFETNVIKSGVLILDDEWLYWVCTECNIEDSQAQQECQRIFESFEIETDYTPNASTVLHGETYYAEESDSAAYEGFDEGHSGTEPSQESNSWTNFASESVPDFIFADSGARYLDESDYVWIIQNYSDPLQTLGYARNEIYARHGNQFDKPKYQDWFNGKSWYTPTHKVSDNELNQYEKANVQTILEWEKRLTP